MEHYVKDRQRSSIEAIKTKLGRKQFLACEAENDLAERSFDGKKVFWLDNGRYHASRLPTCCEEQN
jgi:hypothetical protein